jgi:hypothetical protein
MSKNTNLSFLTDFLTADIVNSRVGMNNVSPQSTFDVTGTGKFSGILTLGSTVSNGTYTYTLPSATGTLALTSDIPSVSGYVPYTGATQAVNLGFNQLLASTLTINGDSLTGGSYLGFKHSTSVNTGNDGYTSIYTFGTNTIGFKSISGATTKDFSFSMASITPGVPGGRIYTLPDADGTIALTSDLSSYVTLGTAQSITGVKTFATGSLILAGTGTASPTIIRNTSGTTGSTGGFNTIGFNSNNNIFVDTTSSGGFIFDFNNTVSNRTYTLQDSSGTLAFTSQIPTVAGVYLPLAGGTLTGALNGTSAVFSGNATVGNAGGTSTLTIGNTAVTGAGFINIITSSVFRNWQIAANQYVQGLSFTPSTAAGGTTFTTPVLDILSTGAATFSGHLGINGVGPTYPLYVRVGTNKRFRIVDGGTNFVQLSAINDAESAYTPLMLGNDWLNIDSTGEATFSNSVTAFSTIVRSSGQDGAAGPVMRLTSTNSNAGARNWAIINSWDNFGDLTFRVSNAKDGNALTAGTSRMMINREGNVGIGTTNPNAQLSGTYGLSIVDASNAALGLSNGTNHWLNYLSGTTYRIWNNSVSEVMTFTLGGNVGIGTTTINSERLTIVQTTGNASALYVYTTGVATGQSYGATIVGGTNASDASFRVFNQGAGTNYFSIRGDGYFQASGVYNFTSSGGTAVYVSADGGVYRFTSSLRYKREINDYTKGLSEVLQIKPKSFKSINSKEGEKIFAGLIAEQIDELGLTEFVEYNDKGQPDAVHYSAMTALLIKAIQEQQQQIDKLKNV